VSEQYTDSIINGATIKVTSHPVFVIKQKQGFKTETQMPQIYTITLQLP